MVDWSSGYVTEVGYTHGFYREMTPNFLRFALLLSAIDLPERPGRRRYLELGCGQGLTANIIATSNPDWDVDAVDFNPGQISGAARLAQRAGVPNIQFHNTSFARFCDESAGSEFDIIALHGIWSWIDAANRKHILTLITERLRPGGIVYVSYNAVPGWAALVPLRQLLLEYANSLRPKPLTSRITEALAFARRLQAAGARVFAANPRMDAELTRLSTMPVNYLAHEFFNESWTQFSFSEVAQQMREAQLEFAGSASITDRLDVINLTPAQTNLLKEFEDTVGRETMRDFITNSQFRRDIFSKGPLRTSVRSAQSRLLATTFVLVVPPSSVPQTVTSGLGQVGLLPEIYGPIVAAFADGPRLLSDVYAAPGVAGIPLEQMLQAISVLVGINCLMPGHPELGSVERHERTTAFNNVVCATTRREGAETSFFASPVLGGGVPVDRIHQLLLALEGNAPDPAVAAWQELRAVGRSLHRDGKAVEGDEANIAELRRIRAELFKTQVPILNTLKVA